MGGDRQSDELTCSYRRVERRGRLPGHIGWGTHALAGGALSGLGVSGHIPLALGGAAGLAALHAGRGLAQRAAARRAISDAYPALTGQTLANPEQRVGELIKNLMLGSLNQGSGKPNPIDYVPSAIAPFAYSAF